MARVKKNIWLLFFIIVLFGFLLLSGDLRKRYFAIQDGLIRIQENRITLVNLALTSLLRHQEQEFSFIADHLREEAPYPETPAALPYFDKILGGNPSLTGLAFINTQGDYVYVSSNVDREGLVNAFTAFSLDGRSFFVRALGSKEMIIGKTYYYPPLDKPIIPLAKSIYDGEGKLLGVIAMGLNIESSADLLSGKLHMGPYDVLYFYRDSDRYIQYRSSEIKLDKPYYQDPLPMDLVRKGFARLEEKYGVSYGEMKKSGGLYTIKSVDRWGKLSLSTLTYNESYGLWIVSDFHQEAFTQRFRPVFVLDVSLFLFFLILTTAMTITIYQSEKKKQEALLRQANSDFLTGLPNRNYLKNVMDKWIYPSCPSFALFLIDVDQFKHVNNSFGENYGDKLLVEMGEILRAAAWEGSLVLRFEGDEFYVMTPLTERNSNRETLEKIGTRIKDSLSRTYIMGHFQFFVSVCVAAVLCPDQGRDWNSLSRAAGIAMGEAKKNRKELRVFNKDMEKYYLDEVSIKNHLRDALVKGELYAVYQPQVDMTGRITGMEALARWKSPVLGQVSPDRFIRAAESSGLMGEVGDFLLIRIFEDLKQIKETMNPDITVSINISVKQFMGADFLESLMRTIEKYAIDRSMLTLEITENLFIEDLEYLIPLLQKIREKGLKISMDDFGTGYSSLSIIGKLPIDELKVDKSFIDHIREDRKDQQMVKNVIAIGNNLGCRVVAEGVETEEQRQLLNEMGCDLIQGYYYSKPLRRAELQEFLLKGNVKKADVGSSV